MSLQRLNPGWKVERTGGKAEAKHGTDILVTIPDVFRDGFYGIAIQVKDYEGFINDDPIRQILKAKEGYWKDFGIAILELVIVLIGGDRQAGRQLAKSAAEKGVRLIWSTDGGVIFMYLRSVSTKRDARLSNSSFSLSFFEGELCW